MMMKKKSLWSSVSALIVVVLAIMAFVRSSAQMWLLAISFAVWAVFAAVIFLVHFIKARIYHWKARRLYKKCDQKNTQQNYTVESDTSDATSLVLLRHVNFRISAYLQSVYPEATWEWREEFPERIVALGGTGRIALFGIPDFNFADVSFDQKAGIRCSLLKIVPLSKITHADKDDQSENSAEKDSSAQKTNPIDPQVWYEMQGRKVLETIITDLASRGHSGLTIKENGEIAIKQADAEITKPAFESIPEKMYWPRLAKVFEREGLAADITAGGIALSW